MVKFINQLTGTVMYVAEERAAEYAAAGHKQVARDRAEQSRHPGATALP